MIWLLRLYPRAWQRRYRDEMAAHLASEPRSVRLALDLIAGAIDARLNPQWTPHAAPTGGDTMTPTILRSCARSKFAPTNPARSAALMLGVTLVATLLALGLATQFGKNPFVQALLYGAFPIALVVTMSDGVHPKPYSRAARGVILAATVAGMYAFFLVVVFVADRI